jgi:facilitated trehalose transporter
VSIFQSAGSSIDSRYATIIVGFVQLLFTAASGFFVDRFGRRALLLGSALGVAISLAAMGTFFQYKVKWGDAEATRRLGWLPLVSLVVFFASFSFGFANVPFIIMGELFPYRFRSVLGPISSSFNLLCAFTVVRSYPNLEKAFGRNGAFWFFMACTLLSMAFVYFLLPETKGKSLQEIEQLFEGPMMKKLSLRNKNNKVRAQTTVRVIQVSSTYTQTEPMVNDGDHTLPAAPPSAAASPPASAAGNKLKSATLRQQVGGWIGSSTDAQDKSNSHTVDAASALGSTHFLPTVVDE